MTGIMLGEQISLCIYNFREVCSDLTLPIVERYDPNMDIPNDELDLFAIFFTLVKILYTVGCLDIIPLLIKVIGSIST